jgi:3-oxoacyl-[acyl-carrier protein] reductase
MFNFEGKTALVTGASGGIGGEIARTLHFLGANVVISGTSKEKLTILANELKDRVFVEICNLADKEETNNLFDRASVHTGKIDILVCNAGITKDNLALRMSDEEFMDVINVNLFSAFILNKAAIKKMIKQKWGRIINISSIIGETGNPGQSNYAASKAGLVAMSKSLAAEVGSRGVTVNIVAPGFVDTAMTNVLKDEYKEQLIAKIPNRNIGSPKDIANSVAFLASEEASYVNGHTLHVNGGMYMG